MMHDHVCVFYILHLLRHQYYSMFITSAQAMHIV